MTHILILEGNTPELLAQGKSDSTGFVYTLPVLRPGVRMSLAAPYSTPVPNELMQEADGILFTGSGTHWATNAPEAVPQREAMEAAFATGKPVWGSCNGLQLAAVVLGGDVGASPIGAERGLAQNVTLTDPGGAHPMMAGKPASFASPASHRDEVRRLPDGATVLASNDHSQVQAMAFEQDGVDFWGVQYHPECTAREIAGWVRPRGPEFADLAADLEVADTDPRAAARLGSSPEELAPQNRARELANWLDHVAARSTT